MSGETLCQPLEMHQRHATSIGFGRYHFEEKFMKGVITKRHLLTQAAVIIKEFGLPVYLHCLRAVLFGQEHVTFLDCVVRFRS
jgi:hypothetical protein